MITTENVIWMEAPPDRVYELGADVAQWPRLLSHYRWVRVLEEEGDRRLVEMSALRSGIPTWWTSVQSLLPSVRTIRYVHVRGLTAGMEVEWLLAPENGGTRVTVSHRFEPRRWFLRNRLAAWIVGDFFVKSIADRTLRGLRQHAEEEEGNSYG